MKTQEFTVTMIVRGRKFVVNIYAENELEAMQIAEEEYPNIVSDIDYQGMYC